MLGERDSRRSVAVNHDLSQNPEITEPEVTIEGGNLCIPEGMKKEFSLSALEFCGKHIEVPEVALAILGDNWESTVMLSKVSRENTSLELANDPAFRSLVRNDTASEFDADNLCRYLESRVAAGELTLTPEFKKFEKAWRRDEMNHALGFAMVESLLYGSSVEDIFNEVRAGVPNFKALADLGFFEDEFTTSILIAYDEISTTRAYAQDYHERYPKFHNPVLLEWIKRVAGDEGRHFKNIVNVVKQCHADRIPEIPGLLRKIMAWETSEHEYGRTFVLDHTTEQFSHDFMNKSAARLLNQFGFSLSDISS